MDPCEFCGREDNLRACKIKDQYGTRYRHLCSACILELGAEGKIELTDTVKEPVTPKEMTEAALQMDQLVAMPVTTSPSFEGSRIVQYKGIVFDETITGVGFKTAVKGLGDMFASLSGEQLQAITERIAELKTALLERMKIKALAAGGNAIIGFRFESTLPGGRAIMVSACGTAVVIEPCE